MAPEELVAERTHVDHPTTWMQVPKIDVLMCNNVDVEIKTSWPLPAHNLIENKQSDVILFP